MELTFELEIGQWVEKKIWNQNKIIFSFFSDFYFLQKWKQNEHDGQ